MEKLVSKLFLAREKDYEKRIDIYVYKKVFYY